MLAHYIPNNDAGNYLRFLFVFPFIREASRYMTLRSGWHLSFGASPAGEGVPVNRELGTMFFVWAMLGNALLVRMQFTNLSSPVTAGVILAVQAMQEIGMRVTMEHRDRWLRSTSLCSLMSRRGGQPERPQAVQPRRGTVVALVDPFSTSRTRSSLVRKHEQVARGSSATLPAMSAHQGHVNASRHQFYSFVVAVEMTAEYVSDPNRGTGLR
jgi:hypothetical protein